MAKKKAMSKKKKPVIIDAHNHPDWHLHNFDKFIANMDANNIAKCWLLTWESPQNEVDQNYAATCHSYIFNNYDAGPIGFERCLTYYEKAPERFVLGYCPDPRHPNSLHKLMAAVDIYGVKVCGELKVRMMYDNPDAIRIFHFCAERKLPVVLHVEDEVDRERLYPRPDYWYGGGIDCLERVLKKSPDTVFLGHAPGFWSHISDDDKAGTASYAGCKVVGKGKLVRLLEKYPNLYCDLSAGSGRTALSRDPEFAIKFLNDFQDRILFGRDYFDSQLYDFLETLKLPAIVKKKIFYKNAEKLIPNN